MTTLLLNTGADNFVEGLGIALSGLVIVFSVLLLICAVLYLFGSFFAKKPKSAPAPAPAPAPTAPEPVQTVQDDTELVAVITAAVAAYLGQSSDGFVVKSFKRVKRTARR